MIYPIPPSVCAPQTRKGKHTVRVCLLTVTSDPHNGILQEDKTSCWITTVCSQHYINPEDWTMRLGKVGVSVSVGGVVSVSDGGGGAWACFLIPQVWLLLGLGIKCHVDAGHLKKATWISFLMPFLEVFCYYEKSALVSFHFLTWCFVRFILIVRKEKY